MGDKNGENFIVVNVKENKSVDYDLICISDSMNCLGELTDYQITTGIADLNLKTYKANVYPNPATDELFIETNDFIDAELIVYSVDGKRLISKVMNKGKKTRVNLSHFRRGLYIGKIISETNTISFKFMVK